MKRGNFEQEVKKQTDTPLDFRLLFAGLEKSILNGEDIEKCNKLLERADIWKKLNPEMRLQWARLAQMAGNVELALEVIEDVNRTAPNLAQAWNEHLELLSILERKEKFIQVLAMARRYIGEQQYENWSGKYKNAPETESPPEDPVLSPFEKLRTRQEAIGRFLELFSGREDCFARQWADKSEGKQGYVPVRRPMMETDVEEHVSGKKTYGIYLLRSDSTVKVAVIDVDIVQKFRTSKLRGEDVALIKRERSYLFSRIVELSQEAGLEPVAEFSGSKGYHFWYFFKKPVDAGVVRARLKQITSLLQKDLTAFHLELFPKQDKVSGKGLGNLVKLPLGIHRLTGKRSYFIDCPDRNLEAQLKFLHKIKQVDPAGVSPLHSDVKTGEIMIHPRMKEWAEQYPELMTLEMKCAPLGHIIASCRSGNQLSMREEKVLFQTIGFLPKARSLLHHLLSMVPEYNPHMVDYKISRLRGKPLGCRRIHSLLDYTGDICTFSKTYEYPHPLLHLEQWKDEAPSEKISDLNSALENLKAAISRVEAFLK